MKRFLMTIVVLCAVSGLALAGDVPSVDVTSPSPNGSPSIVSTSPEEATTVGFIHQQVQGTLDTIQLMISFIM